MPLSPTAAEQGSRRAEILQAALAAFNERGVAGASIEDIRRRCGASVGSIYHHFGGKDGLAGALYLESLGDYQAGSLGALGEAASTRAGVEGGVRHHVEWVSEHSDSARFLLLGRDTLVVVASERPLRELNRRFFGSVRDWCARAFSAGSCARSSPSS